MMKPEYKQKFVEALRSGKFEQTRGALRRGDCYCCLGVLCNIMGAEWTELEQFYQHVPEYHNCKTAVYKWDSKTINLPVTILMEVGLMTAEQEKLINLNDVQGCTFEQIADYVESNL